MGWKPSAVTDADAIHDNVAGEIDALTAVTPVSGDWLLIEDTSDSDNKKKVDADHFLGGGGSSITVAKAIGDGSGNRTTTSTSPVDLTDMSVSISASEDDVLEILFNCSTHNNSSNQYNAFEAAIAGSRINPMSQHAMNNANYVKMVTLITYHTVVAGDISGGTVAVKIQWSVTGGTGTVVNESGSSGARRPLMIVKNYGS